MSKLLPASGTSSCGREIKTTTTTTGELVEVYNLCVCVLISGETKTTTTTTGELVEVYNLCVCVCVNFRRKAFLTLKDAIKCNYDNWRLWENCLAVSCCPEHSAHRTHFASILPL